MPSYACLLRLGGGIVVTHEKKIENLLISLVGLQASMVTILAADSTSLTKEQKLSMVGISQDAANLINKVRTS